MECKQFIQIKGNEIIPLSTIVVISKQDCGDVLLVLDSGIYTFKGKTAEEVWKQLSNMTIRLSILSESDVDWKEGAEER